MFLSHMGVFCLPSSLSKSNEKMSSGKDKKIVIKIIFLNRVIYYLSMYLPQV